MGQPPKKFPILQNQRLPVLDQAMSGGGGPVQREFARTR